jgi:hypothetical protein
VKYDYSKIKDKVVDSYGRKVVLALFTDFKRPDSKFEPLFSLEAWKECFMECSDPTEYSVAMRCIGDWDHWTTIRNHPRVKPIIDGWHKELEIKLRSDAFKAMVVHSRDKGGAPAARWLAEGSYAKDVLGRKSNKKEEEEVRDHIADSLHEDMERLGLTVVRGGK